MSSRKLFAQVQVGGTRERQGEARQGGVWLSQIGGQEEVEMGRREGLGQSAGAETLLVPQVAGTAQGVLRQVQRCSAVQCGAVRQAGRPHVTSAGGLLLWQDWAWTRREEGRCT